MVEWLLLALNFKQFDLRRSLLVVLVVSLAAETVLGELPWILSSHSSNGCQKP